MNGGKEPLLGYDLSFLGRDVSPLRRPRTQEEQPGGFPAQDDSKNTVNHPNELAKWQYQLGDMFEIGTVFTVVAGLLNILAVYDAYGGPLVIVPRDGKRNSENEMTMEGGATKVVA